MKLYKFFTNLKFFLSVLGLSKAKGNCAKKSSFSFLGMVKSREESQPWAQLEAGTARAEAMSS